MRIFAVSRSRLSRNRFTSGAVYFNHIRLLAVANICDWEIHEMDVQTAFLQDELDEEIYMKQPEGYVNPKVT